MAIAGSAQTQMFTNVQASSELRIILLGGRNSGKSLVGNALLNQEEFVQERTTCLRRKAEVNGRNLSVVDTPGWWCDFAVEKTPKLVRREIRHSIYLTLPGPHVFLLVIKTDSKFTEKRRRAVSEHLQLFGETIWRHTLVLFIKNSDIALEDYMKASGEAMKWLMQKCREQFYVLSFLGPIHARKLLGKMDKIVASNKGCCFEMNLKTLEKIDERKRDVDRKAQHRLMNTHKQRTFLEENSFPQPPNLRIVLLGAKGSGKSSAGNSILAAGSESRFTVKQRTTKCVVEACTLMGRHLTLVDTPGWWMNYFIQDSSAFDKQEIISSVTHCPPRPHAFLLVVRVDRSFTDVYRRANEEHLELLSKDIWTHTIVLFTFGDWLGETTIEHLIESEGKPLQWLVQKCGNRYHMLNNKGPWNKSGITQLLEKIQNMLAANREKPFSIDVNLFQKIKNRKQEEEIRIQRRLENQTLRRDCLQSFKEKIKLPADIRVILLGKKGSGKTSAAKCILGSDVQNVDPPCSFISFVILNEKSVEVVDTPSWKDSAFSRQLQRFCGSSLDHKACIFLLVVNASSSFTPGHLLLAEEHLGRSEWGRTMVLFTNGDWLGDVSVEQYIESEGNSLQTLVEKCGNRYHLFNNKIPNRMPQVVELMEKIEEMVLEQMLNCVVNQRNIEYLLNDTPQQSTTTRQIQNGKSSISAQQQTESSRSFLPAALDEANTNFSTSQQENRALACRSGISFRDIHHRRLVLNAPEWLFPPEAFVVNRDVYQTSCSAVLHIKQAENVKKKSWLFDVKNQESHKDRGCQQLSSFHRRHTNLPQTQKEKAFVEFVQSESVQTLINQLGDSNIEELEAFIDSYFEMVWQETTEGKSSNSTPICECSRISHVDQEHLTAISQQLLKLDILDDIRKDLQELKQSFKQSSNVLQKLIDGGMKV